jgi:hypothetical protein
LFYVYFSNRAGDERVVEFRRRTADRAAAGSARLVLRMADENRDHNGGQLDAPSTGRSARAGPSQGRRGA